MVEMLLEREPGTKLESLDRVMDKTAEGFQEVLASVENHDSTTAGHRMAEVVGSLEMLNMEIHAATPEQRHRIAAMTVSAFGLKDLVDYGFMERHLGRFRPLRLRPDA